MIFFFNDTATTEIYTLSLHDALPICQRPRRRAAFLGLEVQDNALLAARPLEKGRTRPIRIAVRRLDLDHLGDRKSTRLNSSHSQISYAVFCLKKKKLYTKEDRLACNT